MGWSAFSKPSPIVTTTSTLPPTRPIVIVANAIDAVIQWEQDVTQTFLEYQVQTGANPPFPLLANNMYPDTMHIKIPH